MPTLLQNAYYWAELGGLALLVVGTAVVLTITAIGLVRLAGHPYRLIPR